MNLSHINFGTDDEGRLFISVEDTELCDYVEDHLIEKCNIACESMVSSENDGLPVYTIYFQEHIEEQEIIEALSKLTENEVVRIFKINNPE